MAKETFEEALKQLLEHEGGYSNHPKDPGGPTKYGITIHDYKLYIKAKGTAEDVKNLSVDQARDIYRRKYWDALACYSLPSGVDYAVFDYGVNSGIGRSGRVLRRLLGLPDTTHKVDETVLSKVNKKDPQDLIEEITQERLKFLKSLRTWKYFGKGWNNRVIKVRALALQMVEKYGSSSSTSSR